VASGRTRERAELVARIAAASGEPPDDAEKRLLRSWNYPARLFELIHAQPEDATADTTAPIRGRIIATLFPRDRHPANRRHDDEGLEDAPQFTQRLIDASPHDPLGRYRITFLITIALATLLAVALFS
jgi:hypothetical protein